MLTGTRTGAALHGLPAISKQDAEGIEAVDPGLFEHVQQTLIAAINALEHYVGLASEQIWEFTDHRDKLVCWSEQRTESWDAARATGRHVPQWRTVREDRRGLYELMTNAMVMQGLLPGTTPTPPFWAYVANTRDQDPPTELRDLLCDSSCGRGLPACDRRHVPPGHVGLLLETEPDHVIASNYSRWDFALSGAYIPADYLDSSRFHNLLTMFHPDEESAPTSPRTWAPILKWLSRASAVRAFDLTPGIPGVTDDDRFTAEIRDGAVQVVLPELRRSQVRRVVRGPSAKNMNRWWDHEIERNPKSAWYRRHACLPVDQLSTPGNESDSA